jgi:inosine/xanthosine triphosphatase
MSSTIIIASRNPVKGQAIRRGFRQVFPHEAFEILGDDTPSGVREQPFGDEETRFGAVNRISTIKRSHPEAAYWSAIEGGVEILDNRLSAFAWIVISDRQRTGWSRSASFFLPDRVAEHVHRGMELGEADDLVFGRSNSKQQNGAVGILTADTINREDLYAHAVLLALIPFINPTLY